MAGGTLFYEQAFGFCMVLFLHIIIVSYLISKNVCYRLTNRNYMSIQTC